MLIYRKLKKEGYQDYIEVVRLQANQTKFCRPKIKKIEGTFGSAKITSRSPGAKVLLTARKKPTTRVRHQ